MPLQISDEINELGKSGVFGRYLRNALQKIQDATNKLGETIAVDPTGVANPAPPPIQSLNVKASNGFFHATISDSNPISKGLSYFVEADTDPNFSQPHVMHLGASRTMPPTQFPAKDDDGNDQVWHFRAFSQYRGSHPGTPINFGGTKPTPVSGGGTLQMTLLPSTGSGTAANDGKQGGSGLGRFRQRLPK